MDTIHIHTDSLFYRFLSTNWMTREWNMPGNLCPFMRRVVLGIVLNILVLLIAAFIGSLLLTAIVGLFVEWELLSPFQQALATIGYVIFAGAFIYGTGVVYQLTLGRLKIVSKATTKIGQTSSFQVTADWIRATHDKICPPVTFITPEENDEHSRF